MSTKGINKIGILIIVLSLLPQIFSAQNIQFNVLGKKNKRVKNANIYFIDDHCGADSIAVPNGEHLQFNCFPDGIIPVYIEAKGYEQRILLLDKNEAGKPFNVHLLKKGWQTIQFADASYKFWKLKNVLYIKEKNDESFYRLGLLIDSLKLFESPYYGKDFYEHENGQDFSPFNSPILEQLRKSDLTLMAAPVLLLYRELKDGEKKFQSVNKLLPVSNIIEFENPPHQEVLSSFCLEKKWIYDNQTGGTSPFGFATKTTGSGLCVLDIIKVIEQSHPDLKPKVFDPGNWYSLEFDQDNKEEKTVEEE